MRQMKKLIRKVLVFLSLLAIFSCLNSIRRNKERNVHEKNETIYFSVKSHSDELTELCKFLFQVDAFSIEIDLLKDLKQHQTRTYSRFNIEFFDRYLLFQSNKQLVFGIFNETLNQDEIFYLFKDKVSERVLVELQCCFTALYAKVLFKQYNISCKVNKMEGNLLGDKVLTSIFLHCSQVTIQIAVFYKRGSFIWIGENVHGSSEKTKWFNDKPRALHFFETTFIHDEHATLMRVASNLDRFLFDYKNSVFYECNRELARTNVKRFGDDYKQNASRNDKIMNGILYFSQTIEAFYKPYFLFGGTLLGWYRDCGIIPHTTDADFGMFIEDYDLRIKRAFLGNKQMRVVNTFGVKREGLEFRLFNGYFYNDLFFLYKVNSTHMWSSYHGSTRMYKNWYSVFSDICSGEIFGHKVLLPCNPLMVIKEDYGVNWSLPIEHDYHWNSLQRKGYRVFNKTEWPMSRIYYQKNGKLDVNYTLEDLNEHVGEDGIIETNTVVDDID